LDELRRLSLNQATIPSWSLQEAADGCAKAGLCWIGVWRDRLAEVGIDMAEVALVLEDQGVASFAASFDDLIKALTEKAAALTAS